jgi:hypothetical protein
MKLNSLEDLFLNFNEIIRDNKLRENFLSVNEKVLWVILKNKKTRYEYRFLVYYWTEECKKYIKNLLELKNETCPNDENTLYYFSIDAKEKKSIKGELQFNDNKLLIVIEYSKTMFKADTVRKISVSKLDLEETGPFALQKLIIHGLLLEKDSPGEIVEETYLLDLKSDNICHKRFNEIMDLFSTKDDTKNVNLEMGVEYTGIEVYTQGKRGSKLKKKDDEVLRNPLLEIKGISIKPNKTKLK